MDYLRNKATDQEKWQLKMYKEGDKQFVQTDQSGNVLSTVSDMEMPVDEGTPDSNPDYIEAIVLTQQSYYPLGMLQPEMLYSLGDTGYRFGFNGQEKVDEIQGAGNSYAFEYRIHDARLGRFLSIDPLFADYPWNSPYAFAENRVVDGIDLEGAEYKNATGGEETNRENTTLIQPNMGLTAAEISYIQTLVNRNIIPSNGNLGGIPTSTPVTPPPAAPIRLAVQIYNSMFNTGSGNSSPEQLSAWQRGLGPGSNYLSPLILQAKQQNLLDKNGKISVALFNYFVDNMINYGADYTQTAVTATPNQAIWDGRVQADIFNNNGNLNSWTNIAENRVEMGIDHYRSGLGQESPEGKRDAYQLTPGELDHGTKYLRTLNNVDSRAPGGLRLIPYKDGPRGNAGEVKYAR